MDEVVYEEMGSPFVSPATIAVCGPTGTGKTFWVKRLIHNMKELFTTNESQPQQILFCYSIYQPLYKAMADERADIVFYQGIPSLEMIYGMAKEKPLLVVLDDLVHKVVENPDMLMLFVQGSHHMSISVVFMTQNLYQGGKHARTIALNVKYIILFANPRDAQQIKYFGRQIFPHGSEFLLQSYEDAVTQGAYGYLLIDLQPGTSPDMRLKTRIFPDDDVMILYQPK